MFFLQLYYHSFKSCVSKNFINKLNILNKVEINKKSYNYTSYRIICKTENRYDYRKYDYNLM